MKVALLITTYNRPEYLKECLWSLERADLSRVNQILLVDDASTLKETYDLLAGFISKTPNSRPYTKPKNSGIKDSLLIGYDQLFQTNDIVINIDSDAIVRPDFINRLLDAYFCGILTGFHCITKNANGTDRHKILYEESGLYVKQSVGGINLCINNEAYLKCVKPALLSSGNWDHNACINAGYAYCLKESVIQHIGFNSSMNHNEQPDIADDFYYLDLPNITLLGVDNQSERLNKAKDICTKCIKFGNVITLNPDIRSKEAYSRFILKEAYKYIETTHCLIFQHDGYVNNFKAWDDDWMRYDYIGAPWWYNDGFNVGNGGFSLRSKRLMEICATDSVISYLHPEDHHICRTYRPYLENKYGIRFAPIEVAEKFSFEGYRQPNKILTDQFGVHGPNPRKVMSKIKNEKYVVNQFAGLGDILFLVPMIRALLDEGNEVIWPIADHYFNIAKHFPDIDMRLKSEVDVPYESRRGIQTNYGWLLPYRFAIENMGLDMTHCMKAKYSMYGHDWKMWRELTWQRFYDQEKKLAKMVGASGKYILVNRHYGAAEQGRQIEPELPKGIKIIEMRTIDGFSLIDWCGIIENAKEIHTANTSLLYILEMMDLKMPIHFYKRCLWGEKAYEHTDYLYTKPYILH